MLKMFVGLLTATMPVFSQALEKPIYEVVRQFMTALVTQAAAAGGYGCNSSCPTLARYDLPTANWLMRGNEIWLPVQSSSQHDTRI